MLAQFVFRVRHMMNPMIRAMMTTALNPVSNVSAANMLDLLRWAASAEQLYCCEVPQEHVGQTAEPDQPADSGLDYLLSRQRMKGF